jgi:excisionase family DNA binding protein
MTNVPRGTSQTSGPVADFSNWPTKPEAAAAIGVTTKTLERLVQAGQIQQASWRRQGRGPLLAVYEPGDVARLARERQPSPLPPFLVPATGNGKTGNNGNHVDAMARAELPGDDLLRVLVAAAMRVMSQTSQTPPRFVTLAEAAAVSGLSQAYLRRLIADGTLKAIRDRGWRIRRTDLEAL